MTIARLAAAVLMLLAGSAASAQPLRALDLGTMYGPGFNPYTHAYALNDADLVVGYGTVIPGYWRCFAWQRWAMTDFGTLGGNECYVRGLNDLGQAVGMSNTAPGAQHAFVWQGGALRDIGTLGGGFADALGVGPAGDVVGYSSPSSSGWHAFVWRDGVITDLGGGESYATAANGSGTIVGTVGPRAVVWRDGVMRELQGIGGDYAYAADVNEAGRVAGYAWVAGNVSRHAVVWDAGTTLPIDLGTLGGSDSWSHHVDANGCVSGSSVTASGDTHAFRWCGGTMTDLGTLGGAMSFAAAIANGRVAGESTTASGAWHAFVWQDGVMTDLGTLGGNESHTWDINAAGHVAGSAQTATGETHAVLWTTRSTPALLDDLVALATSFAIPIDPLTKLRSAAGALAAGNTSRTCSDLNSFGNSVSAQSGKSIPAERASQLLNGSRNVARLLGCR